MAWAEVGGAGVSSCQTVPAQLSAAGPATAAVRTAHRVLPSPGKGFVAASREDTSLDVHPCLAWDEGGPSTASRSRELDPRSTQSGGGSAWAAGPRIALRKAPDPSAEREPSPAPAALAVTSPRHRAEGQKAGTVGRLAVCGGELCHPCRRPPPHQPVPQPVCPSWVRTGHRRERSRSTLLDETCQPRHP